MKDEHADAVTKPSLAQLASAQRGLLRCGSLLAALGESPNAPANIENAVKAVLFLLKPRGLGGVPVCPHSRSLYASARCYERADGSISGADLKRVADEIGLPDKVSRTKLQERYANARDDAELQTVLAWIETSDVAQEYIRRERDLIANLHTKIAELETKVEEINEDRSKLFRELLTEKNRHPKPPPNSDHQTVDPPKRG